MNLTITSYTPADQPIYPPFFNVSRDGDEVVITVRAPATKRDGVRVCGRDCMPGGQGCNNYCAHDRGQPMAPSPLRHTHHEVGGTASMRMTVTAFRSLVAEAAGKLADSQP